MTAEVKVEEKQVESEVVIAPAIVSEETTVKAIVEEEEVKAVEETKVEEDESKPKGVEKSASFKEESNFLADLKESERKALSDLKTKLEEAIVENTLFKKKKESSPVKEKKEEVVKPEAEVEKKKKEEEAGEEKVEEEKKAETIEAVVTEEIIPKEEDKKIETVVEKVEEDTKEEVKAENVEEEKKTEDVVVAEEVKAETIEEEEADESVDKDIELWGVPLLPSKGAESTDVILLKFLRARDFKVNEAFEMLKKTLKWRKQNKIDSILGEDFGEDFTSAAYMNGVDRESHPVCYNVYSEELYQTAFGSEKNRERFLRWRFQLMEKGIQKLDLKPGGVTSLLQIHDLKNSPGLSKKDLWVAIKNVIIALQDNYPEFVSRNVFINVPFWFYAINAVLSPFLTQRTKSKFVVARPAKVTETLLKYIPAEEISVQYGGGFKRDDDTEFSNETVSEVVVKPGSSETIEIPAPEAEGTLVWDILVLGWEVNYKEEFVPTDDGAYTIIVQKVKKIGSNEGPIRNSFKNSQSGKIVLTVDNVSGKKKRVLYRYRTKTETSS
ncbi:Patellin-4 [Cardamine amara subsp. amara]|uniref:Patellin-4 n=1 Tax=Cardamine amara subsp. amara TaxID=228776 RepID=A0ABD1AF22_CARAN